MRECFPTVIPAIEGRKLDKADLAVFIAEYSSCFSYYLIQMENQ